MKRIAMLMIGSALLAASAVAADFTARYVSTTRQLWFFSPLEEKNAYRICVVMFGPDGEPQRAVVASGATRVAGRWTIREGRELVFAPASLQAQSAKKIAGDRADLSLDPHEIAGAEPRIEQFGRAMLFSEKNSKPRYTNASIFTADERTGIMTYIFARQAILEREKNTPSINLSGLLLVKSWPDSRVPEMATMDAMAFP